MYARRALHPLIILGMIVVLALSLVGCQPQAATPQEMTKVTFRLDWTPGAQHSVFYLAKEKGYYAEEGIDLEIIAGSGSSDSVKQLGSNAVDLALVDGLVLVQALEQKVPIKAVGGYYQRTPISLMSPADKPVKTPQDLLKGVKLGSKKGSATYQGLLVLLAANNIKPEDITLVDVGFGVQPLLVGQVDALMGFTMNEPIEAETAGMPIYEFLISDYGVKAYGLTIAASDKFISEKPDLVRGFLRATKKAMEEAQTNKQAAVDAVANAVSEINKERELKVLDKVIPFWISEDTSANGLLWQTDAQWQNTIDTAVTLQLISTPLAASDVYTDDFLK